MINFFANALTCSSLICGFGSIIFSLERHFTFAAWAIVFSAVFDGLDGQVARVNPVPSNFGKELDSLVDVVNFGIAPSILGYIFIYRDFYFVATLALIIYLVCSVTRLAKYNLTAKAELINSFVGLPTTASGVMLASFVLIFRKREEAIISGAVPVAFLILLVTLSYLMVSKIKYLNLDGLKYWLGRIFIPAILALAVFLMVAASYKKAGVAIFGLFLIYLIFSPFVVKSLKQ